MSGGYRYKVPFRRRRENKTNYHKRLKLLSSKKPRVVVRKTNKKIIIQLIEYNPTGDIVLASAMSSELSLYGYNQNKRNIPAAYLTGFLFGLKVKKMDIDEAILDIGLNTSIKGSRIYAALKGIIDSGFYVKHSPEILPDDDLIKGNHIDKSFSSIVDKVKKEIITIT
ncbi:MAG: 50S ribosomal protein L18 [Candidatus Methanoliparum thermophilum]|uniref:Large ribosomal subunit protein uL18 n=1 Tax=Methanoliparum thermophilum TaxID=2491083 RepID=A0A520KTV0_METT2|nr:50S ribosomal protein L18 [Candidatus Methanoliparum sp. LAM-1]RZN65509.1 MAG: 50S ribosomal protein L18 [Candidatus Methanoliparum thermophilum]BDC35395.1 50S ribosomal protein L18 [Candidatus Methanoliparum sp. LAM-1]